MIIAYCRRKPDRLLEAELSNWLGDAVAVFLEAISTDVAGFLQTGVYEGAKQVVEKKLRQALFLLEMADDSAHESMHSRFAANHSGW